VNLNAQDFNTITFQDVVDFCDEKVVEGTELDYKKAIPRDLTKHFAAMSNRRGGLIIIGVEEDPETGVPSRYEGIGNDGKLIERVHQFANNVRPLPSYHVQTTDEMSGKVFLLIRISEGGAPPYTPMNDPTVYIRTGNVTTPLRQADVDIVRDLFAKRTRAEAERRENIAGAETRLRILLEYSDKQRIAVKQQDGPSEDKAPSGAPNVVTAYLQPFYPHYELALPRDIFGKLNDLRVTNSQERVFPGRQMRPIARGMLCIERGADGPSFWCDQVYANGMFFHSETIVRPGAPGESDIYLGDIAWSFYTTLLFGRKLYNELGYSGLTYGALELKAQQGRPVRIIQSMRRRAPVFREDFPLMIDDWCTWPIEADTHQLNDDEWVQTYFYERMREIYWDLGIADARREVLDEFVEYWSFR
jgi:hypothetical protein